MTNLPSELVAGWALWLAGGLILMLWFRRRSAAPSWPAAPPRDVPSAAPPAPRAATGPVASRPAAPAPPPPPADDPFAEIHALLENESDNSTEVAGEAG